MATNLLGMDIAGSYAQGSQMGTQNFSLAMQMDEKERQRKKEKDIKDAISEIHKTGIPYTPDEVSSFSLAAAAGDYKMAGQTQAAAMLRLQREKTAKTLIPDTVPGQVGTQTVPGGPAPESNVEAFPPDVEQSVMGQVPNPDLPLRELLAHGDKDIIATLKELRAQQTPPHVAGGSYVLQNGRWVLLPKDESETQKTVDLDLPDPTGKKWPGGTKWTLGKDGKPKTYIGPAKDPTASARINIDMGRLSDRGLQTMVDNYMVDGKIPSFGFSAVGASQRRAFYDAVATRRAELGDTAGAQAARASGLKADTTSLTNSQKIFDMMDAYTRNMEAQINRMEVITKDLTRSDARLLNVPIRKWRMTVAGSPIESKVAMYITEISNEIGKLSTGSAASVQELSQTAQQKWDKIHDPNLSLKDLLSLLKETKHAGRLRMDTASDVIQTIKNRIGGAGVQGGGGGILPDPDGIR